MGLKDNKPTEKNKTFTASVEFAIQGIKTAFKEERNVRKHTISACMVIVAGIIFRVSLHDWLWLILAVTLVVTMEMVNTTCENLVDMFTDYHWHPIGKKVKDMAAGAVLIASIFAVFVGLIIFIPKIIELIQKIV